MVTVNPPPKSVGERRPRFNRVCSQRRSSLLPDATVSAPWCIRVCSRVRLWLVPRSLTNTDKEGTWCGWARVCYI